MKYSNKIIKKAILEALKLCMKDEDQNESYIVYENDITMRIFHVLYGNNIPICSQTRVGNHYNDLTILGKKDDVEHSIEVKRSNINSSLKDSKKRYPKATKWIVSFWEEVSSIPNNKTLSTAKGKIGNGKHIIIHGTHWDSNNIEKLKRNAEKSGFKVEHRNINKSKWKLL